MFEKIFNDFFHFFCVLRHKRGGMSSDANVYAIIWCQVSPLPRYPIHETSVRQTHACFLIPVAADWMICDTSEYCACPADRGSHAIVPIIPNKACSYVRTSVQSRGQVIGGLLQNTQAIR